MIRKVIPYVLVVALVAAVYFFPVFVSYAPYSAEMQTIDNLKEFTVSTEQTANPDADTVSNEPVATAASIDLPVVMYHSVLKNRRGKYVVTPDQFEQDIIKYKELGYTTVLLREVADFVEGDGKLPLKPMVITFDDGHYNNLHYILPILKKHNAKIVINVITAHCENTIKSGDTSNPAYSCLTWAQIQELHESGLVEIGNHTHDMHKFKPRYGIGQRKGESTDDYRAALRADFEKSQNILTTQAHIPAPTCFAYPFGKFSNEGREVLKELGFKTLLTCSEGITKIRKGDSNSLLYLKRYNRSGNTTTEKFAKKVFAQLEDKEKIYK